MSWAFAQVTCAFTHFWSTSVYKLNTYLETHNYNTHVCLKVFKQESEQRNAFLFYNEIIHRNYYVTNDFVQK